MAFATLKPRKDRSWLYHYKNKIYIRYPDGTWGCSLLDQKLMDELSGRKPA